MLKSLNLVFGWALKATRRGAHLTQQLLQFARRSTLLPKMTDCNAIISGMDQMFRRTLAASIRVDTDLAQGLGMVEVDPVQLETAILNLVINARDAMAEQGVLTLATCKVVLGDGEADLGPGEYVVISVTDTGCGMTPGVVEQASEPFFTTKAVGQGTGLGLPMVIGFVRQSGGTVRIASVPGQGTNVALYFPRAVAGEVAAEVPRARGGVRPGGRVCVLVVEDFDDVRTAMVGRLKRMGYDTALAPDGESALALLRSGLQVDLLLADIVMPGEMQGPELVRKVQAELPGLQAVMISGNAKAGAEGDRVAGGSVRVLTKPISRQKLQQVMDELLR